MIFFFFFEMILIKEDAQKRYNLCSPGWALYRENKNKFQGLGRSCRYLVDRFEEAGRWKEVSIMVLEVIGINELANAFVQLIYNLIVKGR